MSTRQRKIADSLLSIVIPAYNERGTIQQLYKRLASVLQKNNYNYEIIFVDDGSIDDTQSVLEKICQSDKRVQSIILSRNFGHQMAITAGLDHANGRAIIVMDGDLQHPPEVIPQLVEKWREGFDVVNTVRESTLGASSFKNITSKLFYLLINKLSDIYVRPGAADFRLIDRKVLNSFNILRERFRFVRGLIAWIGYNQTFIKFRADERYSGESKYATKKMVAFAFDAITAFSATPLRMTFYIGITISFASLVYIFYVLYIKLFTNNAVHGWASLIILILFLGGIQMSLMGIIGEYVGRIYEEIKNRPLYIVVKHLNKNGENERESIQ